MQYFQNFKYLQLSFKKTHFSEIMGFGCGGGSTCKAALKKFEESTGTRAAECPEIRLIGVACFYVFSMII